ncbi:MAG TPA: PA domain-containing protein [Baekduia sp.]|nr:PA domain-containing protein [Baekduia sp.]
MKLGRLAFGAAVVLAMSGAPPAAAHGPGGDGAITAASDVHGDAHRQHGGTDGHLAAGSSNVRLVGRMRINQDQDGRVSDVGIHKRHAYLGAFYEPACQKGGTYVFDISDPARPKQVNFIRVANDSYVGEGVQTIAIDTPQFTGDVLAQNLEICGKGAKVGAQGGFTLVDVTDPKRHKYLVEGAGDPTPTSAQGPAVNHQYHSVFMWDAGDKAYLVGVDNEEARDVDIYDISDPRRPKMVAEHDLVSLFPWVRDPTLGNDEAFLHDMVVERRGDRWIMTASYWDAGYIKLDVTDPASPSYVADSDFTNPDPEAAESGFTVKPEGNAHQAETTRDGSFLLASDEDFSPYFAVGTNVDEGGTFATSQGSGTPQITNDAPLEGQTKVVGRACPGDAAVPAGDGTQLALVSRGLCSFTEKVAAVQAAGGYRGVVILNREGSDGCASLFGMSVEGGLPTVSVSRDVGFGFLDATYDEAACRAAAADAGALPAAIGTTGDRIRIDAGFDGWGYVHLYSNGAGKLQELDTYALPEAHDPRYATGYGDLSVHEVATSARRDDLAYFAYYAGGFRVARIVDGRIQETGHFIDEGGNNFWGVQLVEVDGKEYVAASDRDYGLYLFEYTGPGRPNP